MDKIKNIIEINELFNLYSSLLTSTQKDILSDYYLFNLSIGEIADIRKVTRAAVEDAIKKGKDKLYKFEENLKLNEKNKKIRKTLTKIKELNENPQIDEIIDGLERSI